MPIGKRIYVLIFSPRGGCWIFILFFLIPSHPPIVELSSTLSSDAAGLYYYPLSFLMNFFFFFDEQ